MHPRRSLVKHPLWLLWWHQIFFGILDLEYKYLQGVDTRNETAAPAPNIEEVENIENEGNNFLTPIRTQRKWVTLQKDKQQPPPSQRRHMSSPQLLSPAPVVEHNTVWVEIKGWFDNLGVAVGALQCCRVCPKIMAARLRLSKSSWWGWEHVCWNHTDAQTLHLDGRPASPPQAPGISRGEYLCNEQPALISLPPPIMRSSRSQRSYLKPEAAVPVHKEVDSWASQPQESLLHILPWPSILFSIFSLKRYDHKSEQGLSVFHMAW